MYFLKASTYSQFIKAHLVTLVWTIRIKLKKKVASSFSVVIPTLLKSDCLKSLLETLEKNAAVKEIIVINNTTSDVSLPYTSSKFKIIDNGFNNFVNPSWNQGVHKAICENIILCNDDIEILKDPLPPIAKALSLKKAGVIGCNFVYNKDSDIVKTGYSWQYFFSLSYTNKRTNGFGCFMALKKSTYVTIPDQLKIYYGDDWIFENARKQKKKNFVLCASYFETKMSVTSSKFSQFMSSDLLEYKKWSLKSK